MKPLSLEQEAFAEFLREHHVGKSKAITSTKMKHWGSGPKIRETVHALRVAGFPICSGPDGYYFAKDSRELNGTLKFIKSHLNATQMAYNGLLDTFYEMKHEEIVSDGDK